MAALLLLAVVHAQTTLTVTNVFNLQPIKKGLTMQATVWPSY